MSHIITWRVEGLNDLSDARAIEQALKDANGVKEVEVSLFQKRVGVELKDGASASNLEVTLEGLKKLGYEFHQENLKESSAYNLSSVSDKKNEELFKNPLVIGCVIVFLIISGLIWNNSEAIKTKNEVELQRIELERDKTESDEQLKQQKLQQERDLKEAELQAEKEAADAKAAELERLQEEEKEAYIDCIAEAQDEYDLRAAQGPIFGDGPRELMESKKRDCERLYGN